jgi:site-specific recombinase XerD
LAKGTDLETVAQLLGHADIECSLPYLEVDPRKLREMFAVVI